MTTSSRNGNAALSRLVYGKDDALFGAIEEMQGESRPFGRFLDAGTGLHSLRWMGTLSQDRGMTEFTAVTADATMQHNVQKEVDALGLDRIGTVVMGNWFVDSSSSDSDSLKEPIPPNDLYDTILADYLIGAMDGFSPYKQDCMLDKLVQHLVPGGRLYIVGLEPLPDKVHGPANVICKVRQVRDACILLAGHRCYREYPVEWMHRQIARVPQLKLVGTNDENDADMQDDERQHTRRFPILYKHETICRQIKVGRSKLPLFPDPTLAEGMGKVLDELERESLEATEQSPTGRLELGFDYVVACERV